MESPVIPDKKSASAAQAYWHIGDALLADGWARDVRIGFSEGMIVSVTRGVAAEQNDTCYALAVPGVGNLHSHAFQRAMSGLTERQGADGSDFWAWRTLMYQLVERFSPDDLEAVAALAYIEMLETGFTHVGEFHYLHHGPDGTGYDNPSEMAEGIAAAATEAGIGLTLLPVFYAHAGFGGAAPHEGQRRFITNPGGFARLVEGCRRAVQIMPGAVIGIAPHSLRAVTPDELAAILPLREAGPVHIHIAEQQQEVADCVAHTGTRPVEWLLDNAPVGKDWCLVHATHVTGDEIERITKHGAVVGLCPITEANLGDGVFPAARFQALGGRFGVGSDSNVRIDLSEELRLLEYGQRLTLQKRTVLAGKAQRSTGRALLDSTVAGGAQALHSGCGIAVGQPATIVTLVEGHPDFLCRKEDQIVDSLIFGKATGAIEDVWQGGQRMVEKGRHIRRDAIEQRFRRAMKGLLAV